MQGCDMESGPFTGSIRGHLFCPSGSAGTVLNLSNYESWKPGICFVRRTSRSLSGVNAQHMNAPKVLSGQSHSPGSAGTPKRQ